MVFSFLDISLIIFKQRKKKKKKRKRKEKKFSI